MPFPYLDAPTPLAFAHRGGAADGDENTAEAFERAVKLGYRYVETDVHATADGIPVVFHDATLDRVTDGAGAIESLTWSDLQSVRIGGAALVPRLDEILAAWPETRFNIDIKADPGVAPTVECVRTSGATDRVLLASFSNRRLAQVRSLAGPSVATSLGSRSAALLRLASVTGTPVRFPTSVAAVQVPPRHGRFTVVDRRFIALAHRLGLQVHVWTIDDPTEMNRLLDLGVDGIMTDRLTVLKEVYQSRGLWP
ncbi:glycerophosphoryl diester phosphodiesterase [Paractinoplanes abujensis]|uniref:Glycerophosphoryl diester phosphodiesterase n=1 Tax=Paractinoplanes abujensis TaxID=882441 RepID=A0A7W7CZR1_9ACTN|nr:glycerophosphodiester phosphodiesterase [Actinoplanes abujensis]MBB4697680.1 glycerophosphoryl diester phosphodiesterase [Actinoplanes abujensis]GID19832.1 glycerophosphoryl diester phosphodiesterase [Actinoplanes abujensis]